MCLLSVMSFMYGYARTSDIACWVDGWFGNGSDCY